MIERKYIKKGDFKVIYPCNPLNPGQLKQSVEYHNIHKNPIITTLSFHGYYNSSDIHIWVHFSKKIGLINFLSKLPSEIVILWGEDSIDPLVNNLKGENEEHLFHFMVEIEKSVIFKQILSQVHLLDPLDYETRNELAVTLNIPFLTNFSKMIKHVKNNRFHDALVLAQADDNPNTLWDLGNQCEIIQPDDLQLAIDCYQAIPKTNPHYEEAHDKILHILLKMDPKISDEKETLLELKFSCALNSGEKNKEFTARFFHELCGCSDLTPVIQEVKEDANTLMAIAKQMKRLIQKNNELQKEVDHLKCTMDKQDVTPPTKLTMF